MPEPHAVHAEARLPEAGEALRYVPAKHLRQTSCAVAGWKRPVSQAVHAVGSAAVAAAPLRYLPAAQAVQLTTFSCGWKRPSPQSAHARLELAVGAVVWYRPAVHVSTSRHTRSLVAVGPLNVYWPLGQLAACVEQSRSVDAVGAPLSYSSCLHAVSAVHGVPSDTSEKLPPAARGSCPAATVVHAAQVRSAVEPPLSDWPCPTAHVDLVLHEVLPASSWYWPGALVLSHTLHALLSSEDAGCALRYLPTPHATHDVCDDCGWYLPEAHAVQAIDSTDDASVLLRCLPAAQAMHDVCPSVGWYVPLLHSLHATDSADEEDAPLRYLPVDRSS